MKTDKKQRIITALKIAGVLVAAYVAIEVWRAILWISYAAGLTM